MPDMRAAPRLHPPVPVVPHLFSRVGTGGADTWGQEGELVRPLGWRGVIGYTPLQVDVVPGAVQVIVPPTLNGAWHTRNSSHK